MTIKYSRKARGDQKIAKAGGANIRVSFKNSRETSAVLKNMQLNKAKVYLKNVLARQDCVPFARYRYGVGRCSQAKKYGQALGRWPEKAVKILLALIENAESNAVQQGMNTEKLVISHIQVNKAQKMRRRTYRAHGRINKYESSPSHIQLILSNRTQTVQTGQSAKAKKINGAAMKPGQSAQ